MDVANDRIINVPISDDDIELKLHLFKVHSAKVNLKELVEMCTEVEEKEEREGCKGKFKNISPKSLSIKQ